MKLDLGGIAKGFIVDRALSLLEGKDVQAAFLNAGGDIKVLGTKPDGSKWRVGIRDPHKKNEVKAVLLLDKGAVATSGDYERFFEQNGVRYHHIIDPKTGYPARGLSSVTVVAPNCLTADALSTAIFVLGLSEGLALLEKLPEVEGVFITEEGELFYSSGLEGKLEM